MYHSTNQPVKPFFCIFLDLLAATNAKPRHLRWHWLARRRQQTPKLISPPRLLGFWVF